MAATLAAALAPVAAAVASIDPQGPWRDLAGQYVKGDQSYDLEICADDPLISHLGLQEIGVAGYVFEIWINPSMSLTGDPPILGRSSSSCPSGLVDSTGLSEGTHWYRVLVPEDEESASSPWTVYVDRTAPSTPGGFERSLNASTGQATIQWDAITDPDLPDDSPGSGVTLVEARYSINGGAYSAWAATSATQTALTGRSDGDSVSVQVRATDAVGNVSAAGSATLVLHAADTLPPTIGLDIPDTLNSTDTFTVTAADSGSGIGSLTIEAVGASSWSGASNVNYGCSSTCAPSVTQNPAVGDFFDLDVDTIRVTAHDGAVTCALRTFPSMTAPRRRGACRPQVRPAVWRTTATRGTGSM